MHMMRLARGNSVIQGTQRQRKEKRVDECYQNMLLSHATDGCAAGRRLRLLYYSGRAEGVGYSNKS